MTASQKAIGKASGQAFGRVNLIGEHIDYNGGMVLPAALSFGLKVELEPRTDRAVHITSNIYDEAAARNLDDEAQGHWSDPCVGALRQAGAMGYLTGGANLSVHSAIPEGSGLSSSAALIVAILKAARQIGLGQESPEGRESPESPANNVAIAIAARQVENDYMGVPCGIMDQMAVALAPPGSAMALNTDSLEYTLIALPADYDLVVIHSGLTRKLTDGRYAQRTVECDHAKSYFGTDDLCHLPLEAIAEANLPDAVKRRARHCVTEQARVLGAISALQANDMAHLGALMAQSHISMRDDFEMSLPQIDDLVADAIELGAIGARLTGGGFGGCIVACIAQLQRAAWRQALLARHPGARFIGVV